MRSAHVIFTNDSDMGNVFEPSEAKLTAMGDAVTYLDQNPRHAIVIVDDDGQQVTVFRGASDAHDNYYVQVGEMTDPNDADGGYWSSDEACAEAFPFED